MNLHIWSAQQSPHIWIRPRIWITFLLLAYRVIPPIIFPSFDGGNDDGNSGTTIVIESSCSSRAHRSQYGLPCIHSCTIGGYASSSAWPAPSSSSLHAAQLQTRRSGGSRIAWHAGQQWSMGLHGPQDGHSATSASRSMAFIASSFGVRAAVAASCQRG